MAFSPERIEANERQMFGCTLAEFKATHGGTNFDDFFDVVRMSQSLQSDAQEAVAIGEPEMARRFLNLSKALLDDVAQVLRWNDTAKLREAVPARS